MTTPHDAESEPISSTKIYLVPGVAPGSPAFGPVICGLITPVTGSNVFAGNVSGSTSKIK